jgi:hypothetical protein
MERWVDSKGSLAPNSVPTELDHGGDMAGKIDWHYTRKG